MKEMVLIDIFISSSLKKINMKLMFSSVPLSKGNQYCANSLIIFKENVTYFTVRRTGESKSHECNLLNQKSKPAAK
jgi:hypothetical protein